LASASPVLTATFRPLASVTGLSLSLMISCTLLVTPAYAGSVPNPTSTL
jgi:hypothetical protein